MYDITNYESFQNLEDWFRLVRRTFKDEALPSIAVIGNKIDLKHMTAVARDKHMQFAEENELKSFFCSAKTGDNVDKIFLQLAAELAGVVLQDAELDGATPIVKAEIVNHQQNDTSVEAPDMRKQKGCIVQ